MFSTGQVVEGAVNYTASSAVCGKSVNNDDPAIANNRTNLTLPQVQACAQPIGPKWVASVTNWLCYVIDGAGLQYASGTVCQDPFLLLNSIIALIRNYGGNVIMGANTETIGVSPLAPTPPSNSIGGNGSFYIEEGVGTFWGPKANGEWPLHPIKHGLGKNIAVNSNSQILFYNATIVIGPTTGASTWLVSLPSPINEAGNWQRIINNSDHNQTITCAGAQFYDYVVNYTTYVDTLTLQPGQIVSVVAAQNAWVVVEDTLNFVHIANFAPTIAPDHSSYLLGDQGGALVKYHIDDVLALGGGGGGGGGTEDVDVQIFNSSGTWTAPTGAYNSNSRMLIELWGGGGGSCIGGAGYGGNYSRHEGRLGDFNGTESVYVGNGGIGSNNTSGQNDQTNGEYSIFALGRFRNFFAAAGGAGLGEGFAISGPAPERDTLPIYELGGRPSAPSGFSDSDPYNTVYAGAGGADWNGTSGTPGASTLGGSGGIVGTGAAANGHAPGGGAGGGTSAGSPSPSVGGAGGAGRVKITVWKY